MKSKNWHNISTVKAKTIVSKNEYYFYAHYNIIFSLDNFFPVSVLGKESLFSLEFTDGAHPHEGVTAQELEVTSRVTSTV